MQYIRVVNWEKFQNYKNRTPPWIRLYNSILDNWEFSQLSDAERYHLFGIWLLASRLENAIPYDLEYIKKQIGATTDVDLTNLITLEFIEAYEDASKMLATCLQDACLEERRGEENREEKKPLSPKPRAKRKKVSQKVVPGFDGFWELYPRKVSKQAARNAWRKLAPDTPLQSKMRQALAVQVVSRDWMKDLGEFIPYPASWLNGAMWEDEPYTPQKANMASVPEHKRLDNEDSDAEIARRMGITVEEYREWKEKQR